MRHSLVGPPDIWQEKRMFQYEFLLKAGLLPHHTLVDIGCGTLRGGIPLIRFLSPGHYTGVDVRADVIREAERELDETGLKGKNPSIICTPDVSKLHLNKLFDTIWAFSVLIHLDDTTLEGVIGFVRRHLATTGSFFANVLIGNGPDGRWREFPLVEREEEFYESLFMKYGLKMENLGELSGMGHVSKVTDESILRKQQMLKCNFL